MTRTLAGSCKWLKRNDVVNDLCYEIIELVSKSDCIMGGGIGQDKLVEGVFGQ